MSSVAVNDPWRAVEAEVERAAQDDALSPDARLAKLRLYRDDLNDLLGRVDTYVGDLELIREGRDSVYREMVQEAREDASLRESLLERGMATPEELDAQGYLTHDDLDKLAEEHLLEAWLYERRFAGIEEAFPGGNAIERAWDEMRHPRGGHGRFRDVLGRNVVARSRKGGKLPTPPEPKAPRPPRAARAAERAAPEAPRPRGAASPALGQEQPEELERSAPEHVVRDLAWAREHGLNEWPKPGEKAQELLGDNKDTQVKYRAQVPAKGQATIYKPKRSQMHDKIIDTLLRERKPVPRVKNGEPVLDENGNQIIDMEPDENGAYLTPPQGQPVTLFMGGGTASGKSTALGMDDAKQVVPDTAVHIDPDEIKSMIPEYEEMVKAGDKYAASGVHEESSDIAKRLLDTAREKGLNIVLDGTGDSGPADGDHPAKFAAKVEEAIAHGYEARMFYVNAPADEAVIRSVIRAQKSGRWVPEPEVRDQHQRVSARFLDSVRPLIDSGKISHVQMWDTSGPPGEDPVKFAEGVGDSFQVLVEDLYNSFAQKAQAEGVGDNRPKEKERP